MEEKPKAFRFFNMWYKALDFLDIVKESWQKRIQGVSMYQFVLKLKKMKKSLKELNKKKFANIENVDDEAMQLLLDIQNKIHSNPHNVTFHLQEGEARQKYFELNDARVSYLKQKVNRDRISSGDTNTKYFHVSLKKRRLHNHVCRIPDVSGV